MRKTLITTILMFILLIGITSCSGIIKPSQKANLGETFRVGTQGIMLQFVQGSPPPDVYEGDRMDAVVEYTNKGAWDAQGGYIYLSGYDDHYLHFIPNMVAGFNAKGKDEFNPEGNIINTAKFSLSRVEMPDQADIFPQTLKATACYKYRTIANGKVCIDPDPYGTSYQNKVCVMQNPAFGSQGAPVAVTSAEAQMSQRRVQFKVHVSNVGGGTAIDNARPIINCHSSLQRTDIDKVDIRAKFSDKQMKCEPSTVRLTGGSGFSICHWEGDVGKEAYETMLTIELDYGYSSSIAQQVKIHRIPGVMY